MLICWPINKWLNKFTATIRRSVDYYLIIFSSRSELFPEEFMKNLIMFKKVWAKSWIHPVIFMKLMGCVPPEVSLLHLVLMMSSSSHSQFESGVLRAGKHLQHAEEAFRNRTENTALQPQIKPKHSIRNEADRNSLGTSLLLLNLL